MLVSREQILQQNQRDKDYFASLSINVRLALDAQVWAAMNPCNEPRFVPLTVVCDSESRSGIAAVAE
jgi:hypothetical protein